MGIHQQSSNPSSNPYANQPLGAELLGMGQSTGFGDSLDPVETYFECITACSVDDGECVTQCVEVLRSADS